MATHPLNLDALVPREDFEVESDRPPGPAQLATGLKLNELEEASTIAAIVDLCSGLLDGVRKNLTDADIIAALKTEPRLKVISPITEEERRLRKNFSTETKSRAFLREAMNKTPRCAICGARVHVNSITVDHIKPIREGGTGEASNARLAHSYCNSARDRIEALRARF